jgi:hypothetical protein
VGRGDSGVYQLRLGIEQHNLHLTCVEDAMLFLTAQATLSIKDFFNKQKIA